MNSESLRLRAVPGRFVVHRLSPESPIPPDLLDESPLFVGRTREELSIVCSADLEVQSDQTEGPWRMLQVVGPLDFSLIGILASLTEALARGGVSVFAVSTFDTDYLLVPDSSYGQALRSLEAAGHRLDEGASGGDEVSS